MGTVRRSPLAADDLLQLWVYVARDDLEAADRLLDRIDEVCARLADRPELGRSRDELADGLRSFPVARYVIFYRPTDEGIEIARVLHGARDLDLLF